jgi:hypothetical protein
MNTSSNSSSVSSISAVSSSALSSNGTVNNGVNKSTANSVNKTKNVAENSKKNGVNAISVSSESLLSSVPSRVTSVLQAPMKIGQQKAQQNSLLKKNNTENKQQNESVSGAVSTGTSFKLPNVLSVISTGSSIGKTVVLLLLLILFAILFNLGTKTLMYYFSIQTEPFVINGMVPANNTTVVSTNPNIKDAVPILRSINENKGVEFTWSCWFNILDPYVSSETKFKKIFSKGIYYESDVSDDKKLYNNSPGLYLNTTDEKNVITVAFTTFSKEKENIIETFDIDNIPIKKWVSCVITVENKMVNIYINGLIKIRKQLHNLPVQNYYDTYVGDNKGFKGYISDLKYLNYAINYSEVQKIFTKGPNTESKKDDVLEDKSPYMSLDWYKNENK